MAWYDMIWYGTVQHGAGWYGMGEIVRQGMVWNGFSMVLYGIVCYFCIIRCGSSPGRQLYGAKYRLYN